MPRTRSASGRLCECLLESGYLLGEGRLAVRRLVRVNDALGRGLVQLDRRDLQRGLGAVLVARGDGFAHLADVRLELGPDGDVAQARLLVGADALDLGLDVC